MGISEVHLFTERPHTFQGLKNNITNETRAIGTNDLQFLKVNMGHGTLKEQF